MLGRYLRIIEAAVWLIAARAAIALIPFKRLVRFFVLKPRPVDLSPEARQRALDEVRRAIASAAHRLPGEFVCFPQAVAAQAMLRRRGVPTTLYYGAALVPGEGLTAHVWLQDGETGVLGHESAMTYRVVARYPDLD
jgi:hypothetical protein